MSKTKLSFSLLLAIVLVGILSTAAFARGAYWGGLSGNTNGWTFKFINTSDELKDFTVQVYSNADNFGEMLYESDALTDVPNFPEPTGGDQYRSILVTPENVAFENNVIYKFVLVADGVSTETKYGVTTVNDTNNRLYNVADTPDKVDVNGSGLTNAHHTGQPGVKAGKGGNTHGFYQNNTNSCASCHQTHTAADGEFLLFKEGTYSTCSACHDGTTGAYNAFATANAETPNEVAGTFNISTTASHNGSLHQADGSLNVTAAPGGNNDPASQIYGGSFDCASCHTPHGAGSVAENNLALDPLGWGKLAYQPLPNGVTMQSATAIQKDRLNGKLFKDLTIYDLDAQKTLPVFSNPSPYILVKKTVAAADISTDKTKAGYLYYRAGVTAGQKVIQTYRWDGKKYVADYSLWLKANGRASGVFENGNTVLTGAPSTLTMVWRDGFAFGSTTDVDAVTKATIALGIDVETTNEMGSLFDSANPNYIYDSGTEMSKYCASCHIDYLSTTRTNETGTYTTAHRHATAQDKLTCVRCHFAHGSDAQIMKDANDETFWTLQGDEATKLNYLVDPNYSSALKRYTGMSVCYACHGQGEDFMSNPNNTRYQATDKATIDVYGRHAVDYSKPAGTSLKTGQPGTTRGK